MLAKANTAIKKNGNLRGMSTPHTRVSHAGTTDNTPRPAPFKKNPF
jgi:hypothetical protein